MNVQEALERIEAQKQTGLAMIAIRKAQLTVIGAKLARGEQLTQDETEFLRRHHV